MNEHQLFQEIDACIDEVMPRLIRVRRHLHQNPELSWHEEKTAAYLAAQVREAGLEPREKVAGHGFTAEVEGAGTGPCVGYRADIDALPIHEKSGAPWASSVPGVMHACGHDLHPTVALGLTMLAARFRAHFPGHWRFLFQPAEEVIPSGANAMCNAGAVDGIEALWALHAEPRLPAGQVSLRYGTVTAAADAYTLRIIGESGHSARPYLAKDAVLMATKVVEALYQLIPQRIDPLRSAVINVGTIHGGDASNVICGHVELSGVIRTFDEDIRNNIPLWIEEMAGGIARGMGGRIELEVKRGAPPLVNDPALTDRVKNACMAVVGESNILFVDRPSTGGEDFSFYSARTKTCMMRLGVAIPGKKIVNLHHEEFDVNDDAIAVALRIMARTIFTYLREKGSIAVI